MDHLLSKELISSKNVSSFKESCLALFGFEGIIPSNCGAIAQLGEHLPCKQGVSGSNPLSSTKIKSCSQANGSFLLKKTSTKRVAFFLRP
jgi:hypothetical protein